MKKPRSRAEARASRQYPQVVYRQVVPPKQPWWIEMPLRSVDPQRHRRGPLRTRGKGAEAGSPLNSRIDDLVDSIRQNFQKAKVWCLTDGLDVDKPVRDVGTYDPFKDAKDLYLEFAERLVPDHDGIAAFAKKYGMLGGRGGRIVDLNGEQLGPEANATEWRTCRVEPHTYWQDSIASIRAVLRVHAAFREPRGVARDQRLRALFSWEGTSQVGFSGYEDQDPNIYAIDQVARRRRTPPAYRPQVIWTFDSPCPAPEESGSRDDRKRALFRQVADGFRSKHMKRGVRKRREPMPEESWYPDLETPARIWLNRRINGGLSSTTRMRIVTDNDGLHPILDFTPTCLLGVIWVQVMRIVGGWVEERKCANPVCPVWMPIGEGGLREDIETHSEACRTILRRIRKAAIEAKSCPVCEKIIAPKSTIKRG